MIKSKLIQAYMNCAKEFAQLSTAEKLKVGCIIVKDDAIVSIGYNGTPAGWDNCCENTIFEELKGDSALVTKPEVIHAEMNAIAKLCKSTISSIGAAAFITHAPCEECSKLLHVAGISEVYFAETYKTTKGVEFLEKNGIKVHHV